LDHPTAALQNFNKALEAVEGFASSSDAHQESLRLIGELHRRGRPIALGTHSLSTLLSERLGISETEARMRIHEAVALGYG
jgi:hypothetical protein